MRKLTVSTLRREWGNLYRKQTAYVPAIRLNGQWLAQAGFTPGQQVTVAVNGSALTITPTFAVNPARMETRLQ